MQIVFYLHYRSDCFQPGLPDEWERVNNCPMCDLKVLEGIDRVILEASYRRPDRAATQDHYFQWKSEGSLDIPLNVLQGNNLRVELLNQAGETVTTAETQSTGEILLHAPEARAGVYSLRFSGFGNGTELVVRTPR